MNFSLRQLRVFLAVAEHRSFSRAGEKIGLSQSAVSRCILELESELGLKLLDRTTREVVLTQEGARLVNELPLLLAQLETTLRDTRSTAEQNRGWVHVATSPTISAGFMPNCIVQVAGLYPQISLVVHDQVQRQTIQMVLNGDVDFGEIVETTEQPDLYTETIMEDPFCLVLPTNHPLTQQSQVNWSDLQQQNMVLLDYASGSRPLIDKVLARHGVTPKVIQEVGHVETIYRMLQAGIGVSIIPQLALPLPAGSGLVVRSLFPTENRQLMLARRRNRSLSPAASVVWGLIRQLASTFPSGANEPLM